MNKQITSPLLLHRYHIQFRGYDRRKLTWDQSGEFAVFGGAPPDLLSAKKLHTWTVTHLVTDTLYSVSLTVICATLVLSKLMLYAMSSTYCLPPHCVGSCHSFNGCALFCRERAPFSCIPLTTIFIPSWTSHCNLRKGGLSACELKVLMLRLF